MILSQIAAMAKNRVIGGDNRLLWHIPEDLKFFKEKTKGHIMIMGRKTFESLGKPLPNRMHIVITRNRDFKYEHPMVRVAADVDAAVREASKLTPAFGEEVFIVGGGEIYKQTLSITNRIYLTVVEADFAGDASFPEFDEGVFKLADSRASQVEDGSLKYEFRTYVKSP